MSALKSTPIVAGLTAIGLGAIVSHRKISTMIESYPFILDGVKAVNLNPDLISYWKTAHIDHVNNAGYASLNIDGKRILITALRRAHETPKTQDPVTEDSIYDDLDAEGSGLAFYWENPWEIKASAIRGFKWCTKQMRQYRNKALGYIYAMQEDEDTPIPPEEWVLLSVSVDDRPVFGDILSHPEFASHSFKPLNGAKSEWSKKRAQYLIGGLLGTAFLLGLRRIYTNRRMWPSYRFARTYIESHPSVRAFYGTDGVEIVTRTGSFEPRMIQGEITISGRGATKTESIVKFGASRSNAGGWMVNQAVMIPNGCKSIDLLVGR
jgi:hypothetical protein